jgi:MFS family permease
MDKARDPWSRSALLHHPNFRWLIGGSAISLLGDQFTIVALPWLVLRLTGDPGALGLVMALVGVPRAVLLLVGGAAVDRFSPRRVLMLTKYVNTVLLAVLAIGVHLGLLGLPAIAVLSLALGVSTAFSLPSGSSILAHALPPALLPGANGALMGMRQLSMFLGPLLAGLLIALFGDGGPEASSNAVGIAMAFAVDAASYAVSAWTLSRVKMLASSKPAAAEGGLWRSMVEGLQHVWRDEQLRTCYLYWCAVALLVLGPLTIALPVLAASRPGFGASALGLLAGAHGAGTLVGIALAARRPNLRIGTLGTSVLLADAAIGILFVPLGGITAAWQGAVLMALVGILGGSMQVAVFTWVQRRVPRAMLGRAMSLFMVIFMGVVPASAAIAGWVLRVVPLEQLFTGCGILLVLVAAAAWIGTPIRQVSDAKAA